MVFSMFPEGKSLQNLVFRLRSGDNEGPDPTNALPLEVQFKVNGMTGDIRNYTSNKYLRRPGSDTL